MCGGNVTLQVPKDERYAYYKAGPTADPTGPRIGWTAWPATKREYERLGFERITYEECAALAKQPVGVR